MRRYIAAIALAGALGLAGCQSLTSANATVQQTAEKTETEAELLYQAIVNTVSAEEQSGVISQASAHATINTAWTDLQTIRTAYNAGQVLDLTALTAIQASVQAASGAK
jgi:hypothetical protein